MTILTRMVFGISIALLSAADLDHVVGADRLAQLSTFDQPQSPPTAEVLPAPSAPAVPPPPPLPSPPAPAPPAPAAAVDQRDPMVPSAEILDLLQPRKAELPATTVARGAVAPLPPLPRFRLTAIVLNDESTGTAMIAIDTGNDDAPTRSISLSLGRPPRIAQTGFPKRQFWKEQQVLDEIDEAIADHPSGRDAEPAPIRNIEPWVRLDGFENDGVFYSVEEFTDKAILLRAYPHDVLLLVR